MDKDEALGRLLARASRARDDARPQGACLDAETLAAWTDGSLAPRERGAAEAHAADCDRCLAVLAAIARTSPPPATRTKPSWFSVRWLVPVTTAAIAITVWALVEEPTAPPLTVPPPPSAIATDEARPAELARQREASEARADAPETKTEASPRREPRQQANVPSTAGARAKDAVGLPPPAAAAATPAAPAQRPEPLQERIEAQSQAVFRQQPRIVVSPDPDSRWRIAGRSVERSTDGGLTWTAQETGTSVELSSGASPAPNVCWIVGRAGLVLLSTDGQTWRRLGFPDSTVDLVSVTPRDGLEATVTAANGRRYWTTDGGRSWTLQENPAAPF